MTKSEKNLLLAAIIVAAVVYLWNRSKAETQLSNVQAIANPAAAGNQVSTISLDPSSLGLLS